MDLQGTQNGDTLTGGADSDTIYGFGGNDTLKGQAGDDVLAGHDGSDTLQGGAGEDYLLGGAGNDTLDGGDGADWAAYEDATAGVKVDLTITGAQNTVGGGTDKLTSIENVYGSAFNDTLAGNAGDNMLVGDAGNDAISGGKGDDTLWGDAGNDVLDGGDGDDYIVGGAGDDIIKGGAGVDWSSYENATAGVTVDLNKTTAQDTGGAGKDTITGVELLYGSKFDDVLTGDAKDNYLWGSDGNDKLYGGAGDDHLSGGNGYNIISGGDGFDTVDYAFSDKGVEINLQQGPPPMGGAPWNYDIISSVEAAMGSAYDDVITGNASENYLFGDAGNDVLHAVDGHDTLEGGEGNDTLFGSLEGTSDLLLGNAGDDRIFLYGGTTMVDGGDGFDTLKVVSSADLKIDLRVSGDQEIAAGFHVDLRGVENLIGGSGNDRLTGDAKDNVLNGGKGDDVLDGGAGSDTASYEDALSGVTIHLDQAIQDLTAAGQGKDTLISIENVIGSRWNDTLLGNAAANHLQGGFGDDVLEGVGGNDVLEGGDGNDTLIATREGASGDTLFGGAGNDRLVTNKAAATLDGGDGDDVFDVPHLANVAGTVIINGGAGVDTLDMSGAFGTPTYLKIDLTIQGKQDVGQGQFLDIKGVENIIGGAWGDTLTGDAGDNVLMGRGGDNILNGGAGLDIVSYDDGGNTGVNIDLRNVIQTELGGRGKDTLISIEGVRGTKYIDHLIGNAGDNLFIGGGGSDTIDGGDGSDTISFDDGDASGVAINLYNQVQVDAHGVVTLTSIENVIGGAGDDVISGNASVNHLIGGAGKDVLQASDGGDLLEGGAGDDALLSSAYASGDRLFGGDGNDFFIANSGSVTMNGGAGDDRFRVDLVDGSGVIVVDGGDGRDTLDFDTYTLSVHGVKVDLRITDVQQAGKTPGELALKISGVENLSGSKGDDHLIGDAQDNVFLGSSGNDIIDGGEGNDTASYQDEYYGAVVVDLNLSVQDLGGTRGSDTLISIENVIGSDSVFGDTIIGNAKNNVLRGGLGGDTLTGGGGADTFVFAAGDSKLTGDLFDVDVITDFQSIDKLSFGIQGSYREQTAASWLEASVTAPQIMSTFHLTFLALQVGDDTYVFQGSSTKVENVVKLVGVTLDAIGAENFV